MTVKDIENFESTIKEAEKIQESLKLLGYKIQGFKRKKNNFYSVLKLQFVGSSFFTGDKSSPPLAPGYLQKTNVFINSFKNEINKSL